MAVLQDCDCDTQLCGHNFVALERSHKLGKLIARVCSSSKIIRRDSANSRGQGQSEGEGFRGAEGRSALSKRACGIQGV